MRLCPETCSEVAPNYSEHLSSYYIEAEQDHVLSMSKAIIGENTSQSPLEP